MEKIRIRDKHPGSATLLRTVNFGSETKAPNDFFVCRISLLPRYILILTGVLVGLSRGGRRRGGVRSLWLDVAHTAPSPTVCGPPRVSCRQNMLETSVADPDPVPF